MNELIVDFSREKENQQEKYIPLRTHGSAVEREESFRYLGVIALDNLTLTRHTDTSVSKARQRLYHLRELEKFWTSTGVLKASYCGTIESILAHIPSITAWYGSNAKHNMQYILYIYIMECRSGNKSMFHENMEKNSEYME